MDLTKEIQARADELESEFFHVEKSIKKLKLFRKINKKML